MLTPSVMALSSGFPIMAHLGTSFHKLLWILQLPPPKTKVLEEVGVPTSNEPQDSPVQRCLQHLPIYHLYPVAAVFSLCCVSCLLLETMFSSLFS